MFESVEDKSAFMENKSIPQFGHKSQCSVIDD